MARIKVFAEVEVVLDLDLADVDPSTPEHEVEQHRPDVLAALESRMHDAFGRGNLRRIEYFEFDVERESAPAE
ncbi:MAG: hypothetical protein M5U22_04945 [Thermoleophilia bacterium]|nr:hypothetical protein [Thermoleophilia bacterium]